MGYDFRRECGTVGKYVLKFFVAMTFLGLITSCTEGEAVKEAKIKTQAMNAVHTHCLSNEYFILNITQTFLKLPCVYAKRSRLFIRSDRMPVHRKTDGGELIVRSEGFGLSFTNIHYIRENFDPSFPYVKGLFVTAAHKRLDPKTEIINDSFHMCGQQFIVAEKRGLKNYCSAMWRLNNDTLSIKINIDIDSANLDGEIEERVAHTSSHQKKYLVYPKKEWPRLKNEVSEYLESLIIPNPN